MASGEIGGDDRDRTDDLLVANEALSQLSYIPKFPNCDGQTLLAWLIVVNASLILPTLVNPEEQPPSALPLDELNIAPAWARGPAKSFDNHPGETRDRKRDRDFDRDSQRGPRRPRPQRDDSKPPGRRDDRGRDRGAMSARPMSRPAPPPPLAVEVTFLPDEKALAPMTETIRQSSRAYALFDLAKLLLNRPERHTIRLVRKDGQFYRSLLEDNVFLSQEDAVRFTFRRCTDKLFSETKKPIEPPKGNFQFVNRCGLTGEWLGPPNFHEYQARLVKHHQTRLAHLPFDRFKSSIETVRDEGAVKAWVEARSSVTEYTCRLCAEPKVINDRLDVEKHIRENHLPALVASSTEVRMAGPASRQLEGRLLELVRTAWEDERKFPLKTVNELRPHMVKAGFHFFKHGKSITYITPIKLNRFESIAHLAEHVQKILTFLRAKPNAKRKQLAEHLAPVDENALAADLHWLIQDGYVVEFFDGRLWALDDKPSKPAEQPAAVPPPTEPSPA